MFGRKSQNNSSSTTSTTETLLDELADALLGAVAVYGMANVRTILRAGTISLQGDPALVEKALTLPINRVEMITLLKENTQELKRANVNTELYLSLIESIVADKPANESASSSSSKWFSLFKKPLLSSSSSASNEDPVMVTIFDDENGEKELVYYIAVDTERKLLKVVFRGSVTVRDWMADGDSIFASHPNPIKSRDNVLPQSKRIQIHRGFSNYLYGKSSRGGQSKCATIVAHLKNLLETYKDFKIRVSGHSLGGALSTAFAFHCACDDTLPKPIVCITFASPRVGNVQFSRAFQECELSGRLRHIRVANDKDLVTTVPDRLAYALFCTNSIYRHVGVEIRLHGGNRQPDIQFPVCHPGWMQHFADDLGNALWNWFTRPLNCVCMARHDYVAWHSCKEYSDRLVKAGSFLNKLTLDAVIDDYKKSCQRQGWHERR